MIFNHPDFALKLFSYLKKKTWNQLRSRGDVSAKFKWSFLVLMVKTAINICKLSDHTLSISAFLGRQFASYSAQFAAANRSKLIKLHHVDGLAEKTASAGRKSNIYSGIRELSEFVMTKTSKFPNEERETLSTGVNRGNVTPQEALRFRFTKYEKRTPKTPSKKIDLGNMTPVEALQFRFTVNRRPEPQNAGPSEVGIASERENK